MLILFLTKNPGFLAQIFFTSYRVSQMSPNSRPTDLRANPLAYSIFISVLFIEVMKGHINPILVSDSKTLKKFLNRVLNTNKKNFILR